MSASSLANQKLSVAPPKGCQAPDRNEQFEYINAKEQELMDAGEPMISVDTKKKENIGNLKNPGTKYQKQKAPPYCLGP